CADEERIVLRLHLVVGVAEIERHAVVELYREEVRAERFRFRQAEELGEEIRRIALAAHVDDRMVQLHAHRRKTPLPVVCVSKLLYASSACSSRQRCEKMRSSAIRFLAMNCAHSCMPIALKVHEPISVTC